MVLGMVLLLAKQIITLYHAVKKSRKINTP